MIMLKCTSIGVTEVSDFFAGLKDVMQDYFLTAIAHSSPSDYRRLNSASDIEAIFRMSSAYI
jgi:hypothetical protein